MRYSLVICFKFGFNIKHEIVRIVLNQKPSIGLKIREHLCIWRKWLDSLSVYLSAWNQSWHLILKHKMSVKHFESPFWSTRSRWQNVSFMITVIRMLYYFFKTCDIQRHCACMLVKYIRLWFWKCWKQPNKGEFDVNMPPKFSNYQ